MSEKLIYYLTLISKLSDILKYIKNSFKNHEKDSYDLSSYIEECKSICINIVKSEPLIELFLQEIYQEQIANQNHDNNLKTIIPLSIVKPEEDIELKEHLNTLTTLLTGSLQVSEDEVMSSKTFDTLGSGLTRLFKITDNTPRPVDVDIDIDISQLKNEINNITSNINFEIKRK